MTELSQTNIVTQDGIVRVYTYDKVSVDRILLMLVRGNAAARYANTVDATEVVGPELRDHVVNPLPG